MPFTDAPPALVPPLTARGYDEPTLVQHLVLAAEARGRDLFVSSRTGSGKTIAFGLTLAHDLLGDAPHAAPVDAPVALVIAPTRELAHQVRTELGWLYAPARLKIAAFTGGLDIRRDATTLRANPHVVVGTPGRLCDLLDRGVLSLDRIKVAVLDEADEMLDLGFRDDIERLLAATPAERRTLLFCATKAAGTERLAERVQRDALQIVATDPASAHDDIEYRALLIGPRDRVRAVGHVLRMVDAPAALVFCATRAGVGDLHEALTELGFAAVAIAGDRSQTERTRALDALRSGRARVLVATDVAARGLDLPQLDLVIHADLPHDPQVLHHRSGRTGRAGRKGMSVVLVPGARKGFADRLFRGAKVRPIRGYPPTVEQIAERDRERLQARIAADLDQVTEDDVALARTLLDAHPPEALAALLVATRRSAMGSGARALQT